MLSASSEMWIPRASERESAKAIVTMLYSEEEATKAGEEFDNMFRDKGMPTDMPEVKLADGFKVINAKILEVFGMSGSDARRMVQQGGVKIDGEKVEDFNTEYEVGKERVLQFGKRRFVKVTKV